LAKAKDKKEGETKKVMVGQSMMATLYGNSCAFGQK